MSLCRKHVASDLNVKNIVLFRESPLLVQVPSSPTQEEAFI